MSLAEGLSSAWVRTLPLTPGAAGFAGPVPVAAPERAFAWTGPADGNGQHANATTLAWSSPSADWGIVATVVLWDAPTDGNRLVAISLTTPRSIVAGALAPNFQAGGISLTLD